MKATQRLHELGQSLWLDNITRGILNDGTLQRYIGEWSVTGLTSNPTIFNHAFKSGNSYDEAIRRKATEGSAGEDLFFELAIADLTRAADLLRPIHDQTGGMDGWVSLEVSPLLANDTAATIQAAADLHGQAQCPNLLIKIPGTAEGLPAIEASIFAGVAVNVTLLFSAAQYVAAAEAYMRGIERRIAVGLDPRIGSVASLFVSRWDGRCTTRCRRRSGIASASRSPGAHTGSTAACWHRHGGVRSPPPARNRNG
ncbi:MAG TPA: transaldolase family protein, partial [Gemmatimonadaceae bacterium]